MGRMLTTTALSVNALRHVIRLHFSKSVSMFITTRSENRWIVGVTGASDGSDWRLWWTERRKSVAIGRTRRARVSPVWKLIRPETEGWKILLKSVNI